MAHLPTARRPPPPLDASPGRSPFAPGEAADALAVLGAQSRLRSLNLRYTGLTDRGLALLRQYATLTHVNARNNALVTDAGTSVLAELGALKSLELEQTKVGDATLAAVAKLPALERLVLDSTHVTDDGLAALRAHPSRREVKIGWTKITNAGLKQLVEFLLSIDEAADPIAEPALGPNGGSFCQ